MKYYLELTLINSMQIQTYALWSKLYTQLHLALVEVKDQHDIVNVGVSFPEYQLNEEKNICCLGAKLRIFAHTEEDLQKLDIKRWLGRLSDYIHISSIRSVPEHRVTGHATFSRKQVKTNADRLARRHTKRCDIDFEEAKNRYQHVGTNLDLPYIQLKSLTNQQPFRLFILKEHKTTMEGGRFSSYGLSGNATVPEF